MSRIIAAALALAILAVPAFAQTEDGDLTSPYPQDLDVNITVEQIAEFYHAGNADSLDLAVLDAKNTFGKTLSMRFGGNCDFDIDLAVQEENNNMPDDVRFELVTNVDLDAWNDASAAVDGYDGLRLYTNPEGSLAHFQTDGEDSYNCQLRSPTSENYGSLATEIERTNIWQYTDGETRDYTTKHNLFTVYAGHGIPEQDTDSVTVEFYLSPANL